MDGLFQIFALYKDTFILFSWLYDVQSDYSQERVRCKPSEYSCYTIVKSNKYSLSLQPAMRGSQIYLNTFCRDDCEKTQQMAEAAKKAGYINCDTHAMIAKKKPFITLGKSKE